MVYGDYEAVMPLPWRRKYLIKYIYTPAWVQQLGVFSTKDFTQQEYLHFIEAIPQKFIKVDYLLNEKNNFQHPNLSYRDNYLLSLEPDYQTLYKNFKKNRKQSLSEAQAFHTKIIEGTTANNAITLHQQFIEQRTRLTIKDYHNLEKLLNALTVHQQVFYYNCYFEEDLVGSAVILYNKCRYYYLMSAVNEKGKKVQAMSLILNTFIKNHAQEKAIFDFEGSMLAGVASFFRSFGAEKVSYYYYQKKFWDFFRLK